MNGLKLSRGNGTCQAGTSNGTSNGLRLRRCRELSSGVLGNNPYACCGNRKLTRDQQWLAGITPTKEAVYLAENKASAPAPFILPVVPGGDHELLVAEGVDGIEAGSA